LTANEIIINAFLEEAGELLSSLEGLILDLEEDPNNRDVLDALFRVIHTVKSSSGMAGFDSIYQFVHQIEDPFDDIRNGKKSFTAEVANLTLEARDIVSTLLENGEDVSNEMQERMDVIVATLGGKNIVVEEVPVSVVESGFKSYRISFAPFENIFIQGTDLFMLLSELSTLGDVTVISSYDEIPTLSEIVPERCYSKWDIIISTTEPLVKIKDVFIFVESDSTIEYREIDHPTLDDDYVPKLGEILEDRGDLTPESLNDVLGSQKKIGELLVDNNKVSLSQLDAALKEQKHIKKIRKKNISATTSSIRVGTDKLDKFVDLVGELVTMQAQLAQFSQKLGNMELDSLSESFQRLMDELRDSALGIRMVPVENSFSSFRRLVRDLSKNLGKDIDYEYEGGDTELDKIVIDRLHDPLVHMIRNSIDHGIEDADERIASGKDPVGKIILKARHAGGTVNVSVEDDGRGIDSEKIRQKAVSKGLIPEDKILSRQEIFNLLFKSGFSTAEKVSTVSGRGVGMDVVKREIDSLGGSILIDSVAGEYSKFSFNLPLTLAIIDGLLVRIGTDHYVLPLSSVESCLDKKDIIIEEKSGKGSIIHYRDHFISYIPLRKYLKYDGDSPEHEQVIIVQNDDSYYGIIVDEVIGDNQTVIKSLGMVFKDAKAFSGATILGDGTIALILNTGMLSRLFEESLQKETIE